MNLGASSSARTCRQVKEGHSRSSIGRSQRINPTMNLETNIMKTAGQMQTENTRLTKKLNILNTSSPPSESRRIKTTISSLSKSWQSVADLKTTSWTRKSSINCPPLISLNLSIKQFRPLRKCTLNLCSIMISSHRTSCLRKTGKSELLIWVLVSPVATRSKFPSWVLSNGWRQKCAQEGDPTLCRMSTELALLYISL